MITLDILGLIIIQIYNINNKNNISILINNHIIINIILINKINNIKLITINNNINKTSKIINNHISNINNNNQILTFLNRTSNSITNLFLKTNIAF